MRNWRSADADKLQVGITATRKIVQKYSMIPALKSVVAHFGNDPQWKTCRPPLVELASSDEERLIRDLKQAGFSMPGLVSPPRSSPAPPAASALPLPRP